MPVGFGGAAGGFGSGLGVGVAADVVRDRQPHRRAGEPDLDAGQVERVEHQLDFPADQRRVDLVAVAVQRHRRGLGHAAVLLPQERLGQRRPGSGSGTGPPAVQRASGVCPVSECTVRW